MIADKARNKRTTPGTPRSPRTPQPEMTHSPQSTSEACEEEESAVNRRTRKPSRVSSSPSYVFDTPANIGRSNSSTSSSEEEEDDAQLNSPITSPVRNLFDDDDDDWGNNDAEFNSQTSTRSNDEEFPPSPPMRTNSQVRGKKKQPVSSSRRNNSKQKSPTEEELFDVEKLNNINIDDINDPAVVAAIAKSKKAEIESRTADVMNDLDEDRPISSLVDDALVSTSTKFNDNEEIKIAQKENIRIQRQHEVGEFLIPVSLLLIPSSKQCHRSMSRAHAEKIAYSMKLNSSYSVQPALGMIQLDPSDRLYKMFENVRNETELSRKIAKMNQVVDKMKKTRDCPKFVVHGSTHSLTAYVANKKSENPDISDDDIEYKVKVYLNLSNEDISMLATRHNTAASMILKESTVDALKNCRKLVEQKLKPQANGEYFLTKDLKLKLKSMYGQGFNEHVCKGLCLVSTYMSQ